MERLDGEEGRNAVADVSANQASGVDDAPVGLAHICTKLVNGNGGSHGGGVSHTDNHLPLER
jgi:hypothetical protein